MKKTSIKVVDWESISRIHKERKQGKQKIDDENEENFIFNFDFIFIFIN
jgi:hypothetical protein